MRTVHLEIDPDGGLTFRHLPGAYLGLLLAVPEILDQDSEDIRERLFPESYPFDAEKEEEWRRLSRPELFALFASHREIVRTDLERATPEEETGGFRLAIAASHKVAWLAALNAARHVLAHENDVGEEEMKAEIDFDDPSDQEVAILEIDMLASIQGLIVEASSGDHG